MADQVPLPSSPDSHPAPSDASCHPSPPSESLQLFEASLGSITDCLCSILSDDNGLDSLYRTLQEISASHPPSSANSAYDPLHRILYPTVSKLLGTLKQREDELDRLKLVVPQKLHVDAPAAAGQTQNRVQNPSSDSQRDQEVEQLKLRVKQEEEKRAKSISLLRAVRQKLVSTEKEKAELETEQARLKDELESSQVELNNLKSKSDDELKKLRLTADQQVFKLRSIKDKEIQSVQNLLNQQLYQQKNHFELEQLNLKTQLEKELSIRATKLQSLNVRFNELNEERHRLFNLVEAKTSELEILRSEADSLKMMMNESNYDSNASKDRINTLLEEVEQLRKTKSVQDRDQVEVNRLLSDLESQQCSKIEALNQTIRRYERERGEIEKEYSSNLNQRLKEIEKLRSDSQAKTLEYEDSVKNMEQKNDQILKLSSLVQSLQDQLSTAQQTCNSHSNSISRLQEDIVRLEHDLSEKSASVGQLGESVQSIQAREEQLRSQNSSLKDELRKLQSGVLSNEMQRHQGIGYFSNFSPSAIPGHSLGKMKSLQGVEQSSAEANGPEPGTVESTQDSGLECQQNLQEEAEVNFEYLRNTLLQFLEHKEMRPHLVRVLGVILHFTPQETRRLAAKATS